MAFVKAAYRVKIPSITRFALSTSKSNVRLFSCQSKKSVVLTKTFNFSFLKTHHHTIVHNSRCVSSLCRTSRNSQGNHANNNGANSIQCIRRISTEPQVESEFSPIQFAQTFFENCHDLTGLPWWASIIATTISLRLLLTLPVTIYSKHVAAKVEALQPEIMNRSVRTFARRYGHQAKSEKWSDERVKKVVHILSKPHRRELYIRDNCHPNKGLVIILVQLPLWICMSLSLRNMSGFQFGSSVLSDPGMAIAEFTSSGILWFQDLTLPDQYMVLPVLFGMLNLVNIEMQALSQTEMMTSQKYLMRFMRVFSLGMIAIASYVPAAMSMYWVTSASYSTCQNILLKLPSVRTLLGMPKTKTDSDTPFQDMQRTFLQRYLKRGVEDDEQLNLAEMDKHSKNVEKKTKL